MIQSGKPKKQRFFRFNAAMHQRQHFAHSHIEEALRKRLGIKKNAIEVRKGDTVKVVSGASKGTAGKVTRVSLRTGRIYIDSLMKKNARGKEFGKSISASNVYITEMDLSDKVRAGKLKVQVVPKKEEPAKGSVAVAEKKTAAAAKA